MEPPRPRARLELRESAAWDRTVTRTATRIRALIGTPIRTLTLTLTLTLTSTLTTGWLPGSQQPAAGNP